MSKDKDNELEELQEAYETLESERNELNRKVEALETDLCETRDQLNATKTELEDSADTIALKFLEANCRDYRVTRNVSENSILVEGTLTGEQCGYITRFVPRIFRSNGKPPYLIHEGDTFKFFRDIQFRYSAMGETLAQAVEGIITIYCPGPVEVGQQPFVDDRYADYGDINVWVQCAVEESLDEFLKLPEAGDNADLTNPNILHFKVPGR